MYYSMTRELSKKIETLLSDLLVRAEADAVFLCDRGGNIMAQKTTEHYVHEENIAALAAGSFFATRELARLIGEPEFKYIFHRGDRTSIYMQHTPLDMLLMVVFGKASNPGIVRLYAEETVRSLAPHIEKIAGPDETVGLNIEIDRSQEPFKRATEPEKTG